MKNNNTKIGVLAAIILATGLNSCAVVAVGAVGAAAGTTALVATDPRSSATVMDDNSISTKLQLKYDNDDTYPNSNIYATVYNGAVLLTGQVPNAKIRDLAVFNAKVTPKVRKIYNYMEIRLPQSFSAKSTDSYTTTQVKTKLMGLDDVSSNDMKVVTTNNVVYLLGIVTPKEGKDAAKAAASINGVDKIVTLFEYVTHKD